MAFIPQPNMELIKMALNRIINRPDPISGLINAGAQVGSAAIMGGQQREADALAKKEAASKEASQQNFDLIKALISSGNYDINMGSPMSAGAPGTMNIPGLPPMAAQPMPGAPVSPGLPGIPAQANGIDLGSQFPGLFPPGTKATPKKKDAAVSKRLSDQEKKLYAKALGIAPADLDDVSPETARSLMPQNFFDPNTGKVVTAPKGSKQLTEKPLTQAELGARGYADRAQQAEDELSRLVSTGYDPSRFFTTRGDLVPNIAKTDSDQQAEQAMRNFVSAVLRKESGAAIPPAELATETIKYFPMPGDKKGVKEQKARARAQAIKNLVAEAGKAPSTYKKTDGKSLDATIDKVLGGK